MAGTTLVFTAVYDDVDMARADLAAIEKLRDVGLVGRCDAAVIVKAQGELHIAERMRRPGSSVIPELFGGGTLPRTELHEAAQELTEGQAGLFAVAEPTFGEAVSKAIRRASKTVERSFGVKGGHRARELDEEGR